MGYNLRRNIIALSIYSFIRGLGSSIFITLFPIYLVKIGYSMSIIGSIATYANLIIALIVPFMGLLMDVYGRKPFIILTGFSYMAALAIVSSTTLYPLFILAYTLVNFSFMVGQPARSAMLAESVEVRRMGEAFGMITSPLFISRIVIPPLAGYIADNYGFPLAFYTGALIILISIILIWVFSVETLSVRARFSLNRLYVILKPSREFHWFYIAVMVDRFAWSLWLPLLNAYITDVYGLTATEIGFLTSIMMFTSLVTQYAFGRIIDRIGFLLGLIFSEFTGAIASILLGADGLILLLITSMILIGLSISMWIPAFNVAIMIKTRKDYRAVEYSKINSYRMFAATPAPYIGGLLYDLISPSIPFVFSASLLALTAFIFYSKLRISS